MKIPFTNIEIKQHDPQTIEVTKNYVDQLVGVDPTKSNARPSLDPSKITGDDNVIKQIQPLSYYTLYDVAEYSDILLTIHQNLRKAIFRYNYEVKENYAFKCNECHKEFQNPVDECDKCKSRDLKEPDVEEKKRLIKYSKSVNDNNQDLIRLSSELENDLNIVDNMYCVCIKDYYWNKDGSLVTEIPVEFIRADPRFMFIIADRKGRMGMDNSGNKLMFCPEHRDLLNSTTKICPQCGKEMFQAYYRGDMPEGGYIYYSKNEVFHTSKYKPTLLYGFSPIYACWMKIVTMMNMDNYIKNYYSKQRPPRGLLFINSSNTASVTKAWNWMLDEFKRNPHQIPPMVVEQHANSQSANNIQFIDFMRSLEEMQYTEVRDEYSRKIGACWGVMPLYQGDVSTGGGLNNEGLQITVTNRAIADGQGIYNDEFYPWYVKQLEVKDYHIDLNPNEEQDEIAKEQLIGQKINNAQMMQQLGFNVTYTEEEEFQYDPVDEPVEPPQGAGMGGESSPFGGNEGSSPFGNRSPFSPSQPTNQSASTNQPAPTNKATDMYLIKVRGKGKFCDIKSPQGNGHVVPLKYLKDSFAKKLIKAKELKITKQEMRKYIRKNEQC